MATIAVRGHHHLVEPPVAELDDRVDHLLLLGLEDPLLPAALHDQPQLLGRDLRLGRHLGAEQPGDPARDRRSAAATSGPSSRPRKSSGPDSDEGEPLVVGQREGLRHELGEHDREQREDHRDDARARRRSAVPRSMPAPASDSASPSARLTAANAEARKPMTVRPSCETARNRPGSSSRRRTRRAPGLALVHQLLDAAAADRHEGDLGGDEEALEDREDDQEEDRGDRVVHVAPPSVAGASRRLRRARFRRPRPRARSRRVRLADPRRDADRELARRDVARDDRAGARSSTRRRG